MSGFAGFVNVGAKPAAPETLQAMAAVLAWRGPDRTSVHADGPLALVHTLFRTTIDAVSDRQPFTLDDRLVLCGDIRLDARETLVASLQSAGTTASTASPDSELTLRAWLVWREDCVHHLRGDFAFVIWDPVDRRLFGARDPFGVRPFYYASRPDAFVFGNMLAALRRHPDVPSDLDDEAVAGSLVFEQLPHPASTAFQAIRRLPGGHALVWHANRLAIRRYWEGVPDRPIRYRQGDEYIGRYRELLTRAVADRLRTDRVAVAMTGGLDSSSIASTAADLLEHDGFGRAVRAHTIVYDRLIPDRERHFAGLVASHARIPIEFFAADDRAVYDRARDPGLHPPEPVDDPFRAMLTDFYRGIARDSRVMLMGLDADTFLCELASDYLLALLRRGQFTEYLRGCVSYVQTRGSLPPHRVRTTVRALAARRRGHADPLPVWIAADLAGRFDLKERWSQRPEVRQGVIDGWPRRPRAQSVMGSPIWPAMFDRHDAEHLGVPLEVRFPFADLALVEFLMNIPAVPWCIDKYIARRAVTDRLPLAVIARPKSPMAGDTVTARLNLGDRLPWSDRFTPHPRLARYVDVSRLTTLCAADAASLSSSGATRPLMLNEWLWYHLPQS